VNPTVKWVVVSVLAAVAAGYFGVMVWRAHSFARVLLPRYSERGLTEPGLVLRVRVLGAAGLALSIASLGAAVMKIVA